MREHSTYPFSSHAFPAARCDGSRPRQEVHHAGGHCGGRPHPHRPRCPRRRERQWWRRQLRHHRPTIRSQYCIYTQIQCDLPFLQHLSISEPSGQPHTPAVNPCTHHRGHRSLTAGGYQHLRPACGVAASSCL